MWYVVRIFIVGDNTETSYRLRNYSVTGTFSLHQYMTVTLPAEKIPGFCLIYSVPVIVKL